MNRTAVSSLVLALAALAPATVAAGWPDYDENVAKSWEAAYNAGDAKSVAAFYAEDGVRMPPNAPAVEGREAIAAFVEQSMATAAKVTLETDEVTVAGDMGFARGTYVIMDAEGSELDNGKWLQVGKKIGDSWYAYRDIWNSDNPLPE